MVMKFYVPSLSTNFGKYIHLSIIQNDFQSSEKTQHLQQNSIRVQRIGTFFHTEPLISSEQKDDDILFVIVSRGIGHKTTR